VNGRRERYLEEMGLGPVWKLRGRGGEPKAGDRASGKEDSGKAVGLPREARVSGAQGSSRPKPAPEPVPGLTANAKLDLADDRAARILRMDWAELKTAVKGCQACGLRKTCTQTVFGVGDEEADWLLVGEAPGAEEDARGEPFVGQAGRLLDSMLAAIDLKRGENVYICNVLKCRPPGNRNPEPFEVAQCTPHLLRQLQLIEPKLILAMGRFAVQALLGTEASIASLRGRLHRYQGVPLVVTYHPAYLLRNLPDKAKAWEDLCFARRTIAAL
jgi:DNA polymerase